MKYTIQKYLLFFCILPYTLFPISEVYNFRIAQITKQPIAENKHKEHIAILLPFDQIKKKY